MKSASDPDVAFMKSVSTADNTRLPPMSTMLSMAEQEVLRNEDALKSVVAVEVGKAVRELLVTLGITASTATSTRVGGGGEEPVRTPETINSTQSALHLKRKRSEAGIVIETSFEIGTLNVYMNLSPPQPRSPPNSAAAAPTPVKRQKIDDAGSPVRAAGSGPSHERENEKEKNAAPPSGDKKD
ncbi:hypothetical protein NP233_g3360 [Leucocoprinus birnbaumii]|uniref:Uncharacterized protein n=1 Tax=Leucocoprinus birnbaumii TaxID=56174 RepID=A0AAD5YTY0_9AGAR|nr:hypothetical protein NP233_g3360 [Leucocoprinus birnbaumii]